MWIISLILFVHFTPAFASILEPKVLFPLTNTYKVNDLNAEYKINGVFLELNALLNFESTSPWKPYWGVGLNYGGFSGNISDPRVITAITSNDVKYDIYIPHLILGVWINDLSLKTTLSPFVYLHDQSEFHRGDEKYGFGGSAELGYNLTKYFMANVGIHYYVFDRGKNTSTGDSGALTYKANQQTFFVGLSFMIDMSSLGRAAIKSSPSNNSIISK